MCYLWSHLMLRFKLLCEIDVIHERDKKKKYVKFIFDYKILRILYKNK